MDHHKSLDASNFVLETGSETCKGCGLCAKRCPMEALTMVAFAEADSSLNKKGQVPQLKPADCIGCGVCVIKCPTKSLKLAEKESIVDPPQNAYDWTKRYLADAKVGKSKKRIKN